jgi:hypothetical protein
MRTTLSLEDDAMEAIQAYARTHEMSLGKAASELIRRGVRYQLGTHIRNGVPVFDVPEDFPMVTTELVRDFLNEE